jgi:hypothetical protein
LPNKNFCGDLDFDWIKKKIKFLNESEKEYTNVLFVFDDVLSDLHKQARSKEIMDFIFNRRHLLLNGMISILISILFLMAASQKYNYIPTTIRSNLTILIAFKLNQSDWKLVKNEVIFSDVNFKDVLNYIFNNKNDEKNYNFMIYRIDNNVFYKNFDKLIIYLFIIYLTLLLRGLPGQLIG